MDDKIGQVGVLQRHRAQEQRLLLSPNSQGHPTVVFLLLFWASQGFLHVHIQIPYTER
jgi:hypothetical protein